MVNSMSLSAAFWRLGGIFALGMSTVYCSPVNKSDFPLSAKPTFVQAGKYTVVEKISSEKVSSLEELLQPSSKNKAPPGGEVLEVEISESQFPEVLYHVHKDDNAIVLKSMGSSFIVHSDGYFLTFTR